MPHDRTAEIETVADGADYRHITNAMPMCAGPGAAIEMIHDEDGREYRYSAQACADARLIAAAPDLLEALVSVVASVPFASYHGDGELEQCERLVRAAIAKAGGGET